MERKKKTQNCSISTKLYEESHMKTYQFIQQFLTQLFKKQHQKKGRPIRSQRRTQSSIVMGKSIPNETNRYQFIWI